jgi:hypothetical protein
MTNAEPLASDLVLFKTPAFSILVTSTERFVSWMIGAMRKMSNRASKKLRQPSLLLTEVNKS